MLLAIDIGNTNISFGFFPSAKRSRCTDICSKKNDKIIKTFDLPTKQYSFNKFCRKTGSIKITDILISSVVPKLTNLLLSDCKKLLNKRPYIIGKDLQVPIPNHYRNPNQVGQDRLVNAYAGAEFYGTPLIVIDFGTAITFDIISKKGAYQGGIILPGLLISLEALNSRTALLPKIKLATAKGLIGKDTKNSMLSGMIYGFAAMTEGLIVKLKKKLGRGTKVIVTGGNSNLISKYCPNINYTDPLLTLKGINLIYKKIS